MIERSGTGKFQPKMMEFLLILRTVGNTEQVIHVSLFVKISPFNFCCYFCE